MSLVHLRLIRIEDIVDKAVYNVESPDFHSSAPDDGWQSLGLLELDKDKKDYQYIASTLWTDTCGYPEEFVTPENQLSFDGLGDSPWAKIIVGYANQFLRKNEFPRAYPPIFF